MAKKTNTPVINIDAQLVLVFNNSSEMSDKELALTKKSLLQTLQEHPELEEPINGILEMLGLN